MDWRKWRIGYKADTIPKFKKGEKVIVRGFAYCDGEILGEPQWDSKRGAFTYEVTMNAPKCCEGAIKPVGGTPQG